MITPDGPKIRNRARCPALGRVGYNGVMPQDETTVWKGCSSQIVNLKAFVTCAVVAILCAGGTVALNVWADVGVYSLTPLIGSAIALLVGAVRYLNIRCTQYELTTQRLRTSHGILSKRIDELELYRVKDIALRKPLLMRLLRMGDIELTTSDHSSPMVLIRAVRQPDMLRDEIRQHVETLREKKRVREVDYT